MWSTLYALIAVSGWLVWRQAKGRALRRPMIVYGAQLALNLGWSALFFGLRRPDLAAIEIVILLALIVWTILEFRRRSTLAAWLLVPYALWVSFATVLNVTIWSLNS